MHRFSRVSPALVVSLVALFFALGGTAFAVGSKELAAQPRCGTGAIRGIAVVTGQGVQGVGNLSSQWSSAANLFSFRWNCGGGQVMVRKSSSTPGVDIKFVGNSSIAAIVSPDATTANGGSVSRSSDGSFHVAMGGAAGGGPGNWQFDNNISFTIVLL